jgi:hypothetical protein
MLPIKNATKCLVQVVNDKENAEPAAFRALIGAFNYSSNALSPFALAALSLT